MIGFAIAGILHISFTSNLIIQYLRGEGFWATVRGVFLGVPIPLCSCSVIPVAKAIRDNGGGKGPVSGFLVSTPETSVDSIALSYALMGPFWAIIRPVAAITTGIVSGLLQPKDDTLKKRRNTILSKKEPENCTEESCACPSPKKIESKWKVGFRYGFHTLPVDLARYLIPGIVLAAIFSMFFPPSSLQGISNQLVVYVAAIAIGLPLYVCSTASTPLAASLLISGISPGAVLLFLLVGPATNIVNIATLKTILGVKGAIYQILSITLISLLFAIFVDFVYFQTFATHTIPPQTSSDSESISLYPSIAGIVLVFVLLYGLIMDIRVHFRSTAS